LEKTSEIIKSSCQPNTTTPNKPCPEVPYLHSFWTASGMVTPPLPWAAYSNHRITESQNGRGWKGLLWVI